MDTDTAIPNYGDDTAAALHAEVAAMNVDNFLVRPQWRVVEKYAEVEAWAQLGDDDLHALANEVAGLPRAGERRRRGETVRPADVPAALAILRQSRR